MSKGDFLAGATLHCGLTTYGYSGPQTLVGGSVVAYRNAETTPITAGITLSANFAGIVGFNLVTVDTTGYQTAKSYQLVLASGTVDGESRAGALIDYFTIELESALRPSSIADIATAVWSYSTRTLTSLGAAATDVAAEVWNSIASAFNIAGTMGAKLNAAASSGDPWTTELPGSYPEGSAGELLGNLESSIVADLSGGEITIVSPFNPTTGKLTIVRGDDYPADEDGAIPPFTSTSWPDLTDAAEVRMTVRLRTPSTGVGGQLIFSVTDVELSRMVGSGEQSVTFELTTAETTLLTPGNNTAKWDIQATLASGALKTLATGLMDVVEDQTR